MKNPDGQPQANEGSRNEDLDSRIKELIEKNRELTIAKQEAEQANEAKSLFLASMTHELRTPLNAVIGYSEMLKEEAEDEGLDQFVPDLDRIHSAGRHLLALISNILDISKIEAGKMTVFPEWFDISELIKEVTETIRPLVAGSKNRFEVSCAQDAGKMYSDLTKIRHSLFNLLSNAVKFTEEGLINLEVRREARNNTDWLTFVVSDNGIGMSVTQLDKLFKPFSQADGSTSKKYGGTGLGLTITREFTEMLGGEISVESKQGEGSKFTIRVPVSIDTVRSDPGENATAAGSGANDADSSSSRTSIPSEATVLVIDDSEDTRDMMKRTLTKVGYRVETAKDGPKGLEMARKLKPSVITLDVMMPEMDGWEVLNALKGDRELADIPVVMLTALSDEREKGISMGAAEFLTNKHDRQGIRSTLNRYRWGEGTPKALVVDDDQSNREMMRRQLDKEGWETECAANGKEALERLESGELPSVLFLDLQMPVMNGMNFLDEIQSRQEFALIPVVIVTGRDLPEKDRRRLNGEVMEIIEKGRHSPKELEAKLRNLIGLH